MDTASVIASALAAGAVAIGVAGRVAHHQARGGRTDAARQELAAVVAPLRAELTSYRAGMSTGLRRDNTSHGQDYVLASRYSRPPTGCHTFGGVACNAVVAV